MNYIRHIQYPVGQGGLHLCITESSAYIYDCGGRGGNTDWKSILRDLDASLQNCQSLYIFISHLHQDHCNKLMDVLREPNVQKTTKQIYMPAMCPIEKIMLLTEYDGDSYSQYYNLVTQPVIKQDKKDITIIRIQKGQEEKIHSDGLLLYPYVTNVSQEIIQKFQDELEKNNLDADTLLNDLKVENKDLLATVKNIFAKAISSDDTPKRITNKCMLCLYAGGPNNQHWQGCCCRDWCNITWKNDIPIYGHNCIECLLNDKPICRQCRMSWLHTGDIDLSNDTDLDALANHYGALLNNVRVAQIPHHGSKNNHNSKFSNIFWCNGKATLFYYTYYTNCVTLDLSNINVRPDSILCVSDDSTIKIQGVL